MGVFDRISSNQSTSLGIPDIDRMDLSMPMECVIHPENRLQIVRDLFAHPFLYELAFPFQIRRH